MQSHAVCNATQCVCMRCYTIQCKAGRRAFRICAGVRCEASAIWCRQCSIVRLVQHTDRRRRPTTSNRRRRCFAERAMQVDVMRWGATAIKAGQGGVMSKAVLCESRVNEMQNDYRPMHPMQCNVSCYYVGYVLWQPSVLTPNE